jgi:hypothetical protein
MAETIAGDMIVTKFDDERRLERLPDALFALIPTARAARSGAGEAWR